MSDSTDHPLAPISGLDHLWFQVAGTLCNLACNHCFIRCSPKNDSFGYLSLEQARSRLRESAPLGTKEYYFTGGEPFLNPEMVEILVETLRYGPATVLTNGLTLKDEWLETLGQAEADSLYSLEFRVSIDGYSPETNDPIRGEGTFERAMMGVRRLVRFGFLPIITASRHWPKEDDAMVLERFVETLRQAGYRRPRLKFLPTLHLGAEEDRSYGYRASERVTEEMMVDFDVTQLLCEHSRTVTDRGVHVCPILIEAPDSLLSDTLADSLVPFRLGHGACSTCYQYGALCSNASSGMTQRGQAVHRV